MAAIPSLYLSRYSVPYKVLDTQMSNLIQRASGEESRSFRFQVPVSFRQEATA